MNTATYLLSDVLLGLLVGLMLMHARHLARRGRLQLLDPLFAFWAGILAIYVAQPLAYGSIFVEWHGIELFEATLAWTLLGVACVVLGYEWNAGVQLGRKIPQAPACLSVRKLRLAGYGFIVLGVTGYLFLFDSAGGLDAWLAVGRGATDYENVSGYVAQLPELLPLGVLLLLFEAHFHATPAPRKIALWVLATLVWWWFLYLGSRSRLIGFTIGGMGAYYLPRRQSPAWLVAGAAFAVLFVLSNFQEAYRDQFTGLSLHLNRIDPREVRESVVPWSPGQSDSLREDTVSNGIEFNCVMSVVELVPDTVPYNYGYGYLELFTRWIPRSVWPDKIYPQMDAVQGVLRAGNLSRANVRDSDLLMGPAFTFVGHWLYVGGPPVLVLAGLFTGVLFRAIRTIYDRPGSGEGDLLVYMSLISLGFSEAATTPLAWLSTLPFALGPLALMLYFCRATPTRARQARLRLCSSSDAPGVTAS